MMLFDRACRLMTGVLTFFVSFVFATLALAQQPKDWQMTFQESATPIMESITRLNGFTLIIITIITLFVTGLLGWV
ncbi:MAG: cytochrome c oxidase subunit II transmembrane domain-containing protein, partial [Hyphomicrobiales bacterium]